MKDRIAYRRSHWLTNLLLFVVSLTFVLTWLPLLRCTFDGQSYSWGMTYFGQTFMSKGLQGDIWFLMVSLLLFLALFYSAYWSRNRGWFYGLSVVWFVHFWGNLLSEILLEGDALFHGDTLDVHVSIAMIIIPLSLLAAVLIALVIRHDRTAEEVQIPWSGSNRRWMILFLLAPLPIQVLFFATGTPHGTTDEIAVIVTILQALAFFTLFLPRKTSQASMKTAGAPA